METAFLFVCSVYWFTLDSMGGVWVRVYCTVSNHNHCRSTNTHHLSARENCFSYGIDSLDFLTTILCISQEMGTVD